MTPSRPQEIADRQRRQGDRGACAICNPRTDRVPADRLWEWTLRTGLPPFRNQR